VDNYKPGCFPAIIFLVADARCSIRSNGMARGSPTKAAESRMFAAKASVDRAESAWAPVLAEPMGPSLSSLPTTVPTEQENRRSRSGQALAGLANRNPPTRVTAAPNS
jgi:hypothetical protein